MSVKISIIIPVHNTEKYIERCIQSCLNQTLKEIEIVLIDDASSDGCALIMKQYEKVYSNVKCIYLTNNVRQGEARNVGMKSAVGEFLTFVDSDDWIDPSMCETLYHVAKKESADIVQCDTFIKTEEQHLISTVLPKAFEGKVNKKNIFGLIFMKAVGPCGRIIRKDLILENNLFFPKGMYAEDTAITKLWYLYAEKNVKVNKALYIYRTNYNSTGHMKMLNYQNDWFMAALILNKNLKLFDENEEYVDAIQAITLYYTLIAVQTVISKSGCLYIDEMTREFKNNVQIIGNVENIFWKYLFTPFEKHLFANFDIKTYYEILTINKKRKIDYKNYYNNLKNFIDGLIVKTFGEISNIGIWSKTVYSYAFHENYKYMIIVDDPCEIKKLELEGLVVLRTAHMENVKYLLKGEEEEINILDLETCLLLEILEDESNYEF